MSLLRRTQEIQMANRMVDLEKRMDKTSDVSGDFEGSVHARWVRLDDKSGGGIVKYKDKEYQTVVIGSTSLQKGALVELTYANGYYYSDW